MQIVQDGITLITSNAEFAKDEQIHQRVDDVDVTFINSRKVYVGGLLQDFQIYDASLGTILQFFISETVQRHDLLINVSDENKAMIRALMTSTTQFAVARSRLVFYSRSLIWRYNMRNQQLHSYRPTVDDVNKEVNVRLSVFIIAMHQNTNVCYVRTYAQAFDRLFALRLSPDSQIIDVYVVRTRLNILVKKGNYAYYGGIHCDEEASGLHGHFFAWSDDINVCADDVYYGDELASVRTVPENMVWGLDPVD